MGKICSKCKIEKELNSINFEPRNNTKDGFRNQCRDCRNKDRKYKYNYSEKIWSEYEKEILIKYYPYLSSKEISKKYLSKRTPNQIMDYATKKLNLQKDGSFHNRWSDNQINYLLNNYSKYEISVDEMSNVIGKSNSTIIAMANSLGLFKDSSWNDDEIKLIKTYYPNMKTSEFKEKYMNDKNVSAITNYANNNGIYKSTEVLKEIRINNAISNLKKVNNKKDPTKPEIYIINLLDKLNIEYKFQEFNKYYWVDFYIPENKLIIEVQGDYFHCNPLKKLNYKVLDKNAILAKDKRKHSYFKNKGIEILYLWESDIIKSSDKCEELIKKYINNNGRLNDYHSFNYELINNELKEYESKTAIGY